MSSEAQEMKKTRLGATAITHMSGTPDCFVMATEQGDPSKEASIRKGPEKLNIFLTILRLNVSLLLLSRAIDLLQSRLNRPSALYSDLTQSPKAPNGSFF